jgi:hypothetical protein
MKSKYLIWIIGCLALLFYYIGMQTKIDTGIDKVIRNPQDGSVQLYCNGKYVNSVEQISSENCLNQTKDTINLKEQ